MNVTACGGIGAKCRSGWRRSRSSLSSQRARPSVQRCLKACVRGWCLGPVVVGGLLAALVSSPATLAAQAPGVDARIDEEARLLFNAATSALNDGRFSVALERFREAYELSHRPVLLYNIGLTADRMRLDDEALAAFEEYLARVPDAENRREVEGRVAALRAALVRRRRVEQPPSETNPRSAATTETASSSTTGVGSTTTVGSTTGVGSTTAVDTASEVVPILGSDASSPTGPVTESETAFSSSTTGASSTIARPEPTEGVRTSSAFGVVGGALLGLGAASLGFSGVALALRNGEADAFNADSCLDDGRSRGEACGSHLNAGRRWERTATGALVGGLGLALAGTALLVVKSVRRTGGTDALTTRCAPALGTSLGVSCQASF